LTKPAGGDCDEIPFAAEHIAKTLIVEPLKEGL
jgi:hypothetical protein